MSRKREDKRHKLVREAIRSAGLDIVPPAVVAAVVDLMEDTVATVQEEERLVAGAIVDVARQEYGGALSEPEVKRLADVLRYRPEDDEGNVLLDLTRDVETEEVH